MNNSIFHIPSHILEATQAHLREKGRLQEEGVVLWRGTLNPPQVTDFIIPEQITHTGRFIVPLEARQQLVRQLSGVKEKVIIQVHSHPGEAFHSSTDDEEAIPRQAGALSLVVPDFALRPSLFERAALFQLQKAGGWIQIPVTTVIPAQSAQTKKRGIRWLIAILKNFGR